MRFCASHGITEQTISRIPLGGTTVTSVMDAVRATDVRTRARCIGRAIGSALTTGAVITAGVFAVKSATKYVAQEN